MNIIVKFPRLLLLLFLTIISSACGFYSKANAIQQRPSPPSTATVTIFHNHTVRKARQIDRERVFEALQKDAEEDDVVASKEQAATLKDRIRNFFVILGGILYSVKASAAVVAIQLVLNLKMEGPVLRRLPPNLLLFLLEVSINRPQVIQSVAKELGGRISSEICAFTGKEAYEVGDITKALVSRYTGQGNYRFGDLTRTTFSRFTQRKMTKKSVAEPSKVEVKKEEELVMSLMTKLYKGLQRKIDKNELSSKEMETVLLRITGKKDYEFGDVTRAVLKRMQTRD